jgi:hypothetical protein
MYAILSFGTFPPRHQFPLSSARRTDMANDELNAGFTGTPNEPPTGVRRVARNATAAVSREANALAVGAADHPSTATSLVLTISALAFAVGYVIGRNSADSHGYWR